MLLRLTTLAAAATLSALHSLPASALVAEPLFGAMTAQLTTDLAGRIVDRAGQPVRDATVTIPELNRAASSGPDGRFHFERVPQGRYTLAVRHLGYVAIARSIVVGEAPLDVSLTLDAGALSIEPVNVTATRTPGEAIASPLPTSILTGEQVHPEGGISLVHSVAQFAGVRNVSSGQQVGQPVCSTVPKHSAASSTSFPPSCHSPPTARISAERPSRPMAEATTPSLASRHQQRARQYHHPRRALRRRVPSPRSEWTGSRRLHWWTGAADDG